MRGKKRAHTKCELFLLILNQFNPTKLSMRPCRRYVRRGSSIRFPFATSVNILNKFRRMDTLDFAVTKIFLLMKKKNTFSQSLTVALVLFLVSGLAFAKLEDEAQKAAEQWLAFVDAGNFAQSWETAAGYFKNAVAQEQWRDSLNAVRKPLGDVVSRKLKSAKYLQSLPGAPDGEYVVLQFDTSFTNKKTAVETVTPMLDIDGVWRVSGYYIK